MGDCAMFDKNLDAVLRPLTDEEERVKMYIQQKFFATLKQPHWENVEVEQYWNKLGLK